MTSLTVKDILHYSTNFDPHVPAIPYPIPAEAPDPFEMSLTFDAFRQFWEQERTAFQWEACPEGNARPILGKENPDQPLPVHSEAYPGRGARRQFDWTIKYRCRRARSAKQLKIHRESVGKACPASIRIQKPIGEGRVIVRYYRHHNHDTSAESRAHMPMGTNERNWIKGKVASGLDWKGIKHELQPDEETMQSLEVEKENVPPALLVKYKDVGSELYRRNMKERARDTDPIMSVHRWMKEIRERGGKGWFYDHIDNNPLQYLIAWCTQFQLEVMNDGSLIFCLDSTEGIAKPLRPVPSVGRQNEKDGSRQDEKDRGRQDEKDRSRQDKKDRSNTVHLFTILVKDRVLRKGIPVAHMLSSAASSGLFTPW
ncbi:hypothetical protein B0O80DRAFT_99886 [Mortierella sp. GBAus27b]|nr:hypothetical protein B0O80DRAFT_305496 [Mortierella sp. GBAus27b]KAI8362424.1 hypothetical protein B0O80DRAFT_99886 [Mortierella sp. GBAus27b]